MEGKELTLISIIIPIYNAEKYISKCLDSLINQTYTNIEIICVNDGSTDNSLMELNKYANIDRRIKIINTDNKGVSCARNLGLKNASGDYVLFVDADDWLDLNACNILNQALNNSQYDLLFFNFIKVYGKQHIKKNISKIVNKSNHKNIYSNALMKCCCFKREFLEKNNILFLENISISEDNIFVLCCLFSNPQIKVICDYLYFYLESRQDSASKNWGQVIIKQYESLLIFKEQSLYKHLCAKDQLFILDLWSFYIFALWSKSPLKNFSDQDIINKILLLYKNFGYINYFYLPGYFLLKHKLIFKILRQLFKRGYKCHCV